ncbi:potassium transporter Kup [Luteolibacter algae]|uniref:Probable potassium transport system protein Kup n=1 Tax=Luteolibacter algae TaxID=454151 RepID=A0ABW5D4A9_9BACT
MMDSKENGGTSLPVATLAALGIVFGDIGTSPLYAFRECFADHSSSAALNPQNLVGAASLIVWALLLVVTVKYLFVILRLDNHGEGGILSLSALVRSGFRKLGNDKNPLFVVIFGLIGAALIYADGMLTPAISVLSAVEGLSVSAPLISHWIVPLAVGILIALFAIQRFGTAKVGRLFGPVVLLWFFSLAALGLAGLAKQPQVLLALSPWEGASFLVREWKHAMPLMAAVFLAVTGGEALYADLGHFGVRPIRCGWLIVVLPALVLNYLGQAALLISDPLAIKNPFFLLAPAFLRFPLTILATCAAVVASQALISGAFSLTAQAVRMAIIPRVRIMHTSDESVGQVFVPFVNGLLACSCILLVISFGSSAELAGAYGVAIALTMVITSLLFFYAARLRFAWGIWKSRVITAIFLVVDGAFLAANATKIDDGGWLPLLIAAILTGLMLIWIWGRRRLAEKMSLHDLPIADFARELSHEKIHRVPGLAIYMTGHRNNTPSALLHNLKHNHVVHERILLLHVQTLDEPRADDHELLELENIGQGIHKAILRFGFADDPDVPAALRQRLPEFIGFQPGRSTYFLGQESYCVKKTAGSIDKIRLSIFATLARNASPATAYFHLPPSRVVELGAQVTL